MVTARGSQRGLLIAILVLAGIVPFATWANAQGSNSCLGCLDQNNGCKGNGGNHCCCAAHCEYIDEGGTPPKHSIICTCTKWCAKCGSCAAHSCGVCLSSNSHESAGLALASTAAIDSAVATALSAAAGSFVFTDAAEEALSQKSPLAAAILKNLTTQCGGTERVPLANVLNSPFAGGVTKTTARQKGLARAGAAVVVDTTVSTFEYSGTLTVGDRKAILDITLPPGAEHRAVVNNSPHTEVLHVDVTETGMASVSRRFK